MKLKKSVGIIIGIALNMIAGCLSFSSHAKADMEADQETLLFLGNQNYVPIVYLDKEGTPQGVVVDIVTALSEKMDIPVEVKAMDWAEAQQKMQEGGADALIQINRTEEREKVYDFSEDLLESKFSIFTLSGRIDIEDAEDLRGLKVGVEAKGYPEQILQKDPLIQLIAVKTIEEGFTKLIDGDIDAVVADEWVGAYIVAHKNLTGISVVGEPIARTYSAIAVAEGNTALLEAINKGLEEMKTDGTYQQILAKWQPQEVIIRTREQIEINRFRVWIAILGLVIIFVAIWGVTLHEQLARQKKVKEELAVEHERLSDVILSANAGTWEWNIPTGEVRVNQRWAEILGYTLDEISPMNIQKLFDLTHPEDFKIVKELIEKLNNRQMEYYYQETRVKHKDGSWIWIADHGRIVKWNSEDRPVLMSGVRYDINDRKKSEQELINAMHVAEAANTAKSQFLSNMSHEIRTPMNGVLGMLQLMELSDTSETQREYIAVCKTASFSLLKVINDILDYSKIEAMAVKLEKNNIIIKDFIREIDDLHRPSIMNKGISFSMIEGTDIPPILTGDKFKLRQVLTNLIGNAVKFTASGRITCTVCKIEDTDQSVRLKWEVRDTGIGIKEENFRHIFSSFTQADNSVTRKYGGSGLGLSICKGLVELMEGEIWVESKEGEGSAFYFTCVLGKPEHTQNETAQEARTETASNKNLKILLAEDDEISRIIVERFAKNKGWQVDLAVNGQEAVEAFQTKQYDIVLMDLQMPVKDGYQATREIRKLELQGQTHTPIIAMTAFALEGEREKSIAMGMDDYISKPVRFGEFFEMVEKWVSGKGV